jgi:hypothetical protein
MSAGMNRLRPGDATAAYKSYLRRIANMLDGQDFLDGQQPLRGRLCDLPPAVVQPSTACR